MKIIASESDSKNHIRQWIKELTDYSPQKIDEILDRIGENQSLVQGKRTRVP